MAKKPKTYDFHTISQSELLGFLIFTNKVQSAFGTMVSQQKYCVPTVNWIKEVYTPYLRQFLFKNKVSKYVNPDNNCEKFSAYGMAAGLILHRNGEGTAGTSLALGTVDYLVTLFAWHSINIFIAQDKGKLMIIYYEPQNGTFIDAKDVESNWILVRM